MAGVTYDWRRERPGFRLALLRQACAVEAERLAQAMASAIVRLPRPEPEGSDLGRRGETKA